MSTRWAKANAGAAVIHSTGPRVATPQAPASSTPAPPLRRARTAEASNLVVSSSGVSPYSARNLPHCDKMRPSSQSRPGGTTMKDTVKDFKAFVLRGNVVDLAIAVVIGAAFGTVVKALVEDLIPPTLAIPG